MFIMVSRVIEFSVVEEFLSSDNLTKKCINNPNILSIYCPDKFVIRNLSKSVLGDFCKRVSVHPALRLKMLTSWRSFRHLDVR
jgi:hypothetical protein